MGKSGHVGRKIAATFASTGTPAFFVHPGEASHGDLGMITHRRRHHRAVVVGRDRRAQEPDRLFAPLPHRPDRGDGASATARSAKAADVVLALPQAREACPHNLAPTTSSLMQLALGDALAIALLESRGFTALDFRVLHPGGRLGALLKFVRDIMHSGDASAARRRSARGCRTRIVEMSAKGFGCVGIIDAQRQAGRHHHRRRPAPPHAARPARAPGRRR